MPKRVEGSYATRLPDGQWVLVPLCCLSKYMTRAQYLSLIETLITAAQDARQARGA